MAVYDQTIRIGADTSPAARAVAKLAAQLDKLEAAARSILKPVSVKLDTTRAQQQIKALEAGLNRLGNTRSVRVRVIEDREVRTSSRALPPAGRSGGGGDGGSAFLAAAALASSNAARQIAAAANVQATAATSSAKAQTIDISATQVHARTLSQATEALAGFRRQLTTTLSGISAAPAAAARSLRGTTGGSSAASGDQAATAGLRNAAANSAREGEAAIAAARQLNRARQALYNDTQEKLISEWKALRQEVSATSNEIREADSNAQLVLRTFQTLGKAGSTLVQSLYAFGGGFLSAFTDAGRAAAGLAANVAPIAGNLNEALNVTANLSAMLRRTTDTTSRMGAQVEKLRSAIATLVPYSEGTEKAVARLVELEKRLTAVKRSQVQQYRDATAAARAQGDAVRRNVAASAAGRAGSGFAEFSRTAPGNADLAAWVRRNEGRISQGFRKSDDKSIRNLLEQLELDRASQLETQLGERTSQLLRRSATKFEADLADFDKRLEAAAKKRSAAARVNEGIRTGIGAGLATANLPGQNIAQAALAGGALGGPAGAAAGAASGAVAALAAYGNSAAATSRSIATLEVRLRSLSQGFDDYQRVQQAAITSGERFGQGLSESLTGFSQLYARLRPLGLTLEEIQTVYDGFSTSAKLAGASTAESAGALLQLSQALGAGALRGEEFNSVMEQAPGVALALARELNVPVGKLKEMAKEGQITSDVVVKALARAAQEGGPRLAASLESPEQKFKDLANAVEKLNKAIGDLLLPAFVATVDKLATATSNAATFVSNLADAWFYVRQQLQPVVDLYDRLSKNPLAQFAQNATGFVLENTGPGLMLRGTQKLKELGGGIFNWTNDAAAAGRAERKRQFIGPAAPQWFGPAPRAVPTPLRERLGLTGSGSGSTTKGDKAVEEAVRRGVIGGLTGGGQGDASRGRSSGPHLHSQALGGLSESQHRSLVDRALDFGGGRTASSFGLSRGHAGHGYAGLDFLTPQGTPFTLRPGYTAKDLGIRGALGRGLQISGPGGSFQLGHLSGVRMGDLNGKGAAGDLLDAQQDALNAAVEAEAELAQKRAESLKAGQALTTELQRQLDSLNAVDDAAREQLRIQFEWQDRQEKINELLDEKQKKDLTALNSKIKEIELLKEQQKILDEMQGGGYKNFSGGNIDTYTDAGQAIAESKKQLEDLTNPINQVVAGATAIGAAFGESFKGLVSGAMTAQQALANFFQKTADHFLDMAAKIAAAAIQHAIISTIFRGATGAITGGAFGGGGINWGQTPSIGGVPNLPGLTPFADGGIVTGPTPALIGEREPEAVIPLSRMGEAMQRFNPANAENSRANGTGGSSDGSGGGASPITMNVVATRFGDTDFVKVADMQAALAQTRVEAAKQGAAMGEARALRRLQNSPGSRRKLGLA